MSIYVCSDIHGQYGLYIKMLETIGFSDKDRLYIIGDLIDRGPGSIEMLRDVMGRENVLCLFGNHEMMMTDHLHRIHERDFWLNPSNGGVVTLGAFLKLDEEEQTKILDFIDGMYFQYELEIEGERFLLSHSDFFENEGTVKWRDYPGNVILHKVWNSPWRQWEYIPIEKYEKDSRMHVIGHVPVQYFFKGKNDSCAGAFVSAEHRVINIDLGCAMLSRHLTAVPAPALCCLNLSAYAKTKSLAAFTYIRP